MHKGVWIVGMALALQGCAVSPSAYLTQVTSKAHNFLATDSRLRVVVDAEQGIFSTTGLVEPKRIVCTEPSPDVATTIANSFGVGLSVLGYGSGSLSSQSVEGLVQLGERTAAIQLLRDKLYQTCLAYANGAISGTTYSLIMSRLDDSIVTLSLADNAAGAFGRKLAGIGGEASAKADATLVGLPAEVSKIEEQAGKLATANKKVDDAEKALQSYKATQPASGKEEEYKAQIAKLEQDVATAKAERNALLELVQSAAKSTSEATGKISQLQAGGGITSHSEGNVLREMQAEFLLADSSRELIAACIVELGLRGGAGGDADLKKMTGYLEDMFKSRLDATSGANYAGAILRGRGTALADYCKAKLPDLISDASGRFHTYRMRRAELNANVAVAQYAGQADQAAARKWESFVSAVKLCNTDFKDDTERRKSCLDAIIPVKAEPTK
jgi:hypothetical protein